MPFSWRLDRELAGTGALGDLGSHTIGLAHFLVGDIVEVCGTTSTVIKERAVPLGGSGYAAQAGADAPLQSDLRQTLQDLSDAARAISELADLLGRHPEALIQGKGNKE